MVFSLVLSLLDEFHGSFPVPDGADAHGSPGFLVDVVEGDGLPMECSLLLG